MLSKALSNSTAAVRLDDGAHSLIRLRRRKQDKTVHHRVEKGGHRLVRSCRAADWAPTRSLLSSSLSAAWRPTGLAGLLRGEAWAGERPSLPRPQSSRRVTTALLPKQPRLKAPGRDGSCASSSSPVRQRRSLLPGPALLSRTWESRCAGAGGGCGDRARGGCGDPARGHGASRPPLAEPADAAEPPRRRVPEKGPGELRSYPRRRRGAARD